MFFCNSIYSLNVTWITEYMSRKYCSRFAGNCLFYLCRVDVQCVRINVYKNGFAIFPQRTTCGGNKSKRCGNDFSL